MAKRPIPITDRLWQIFFLAALPLIILLLPIGFAFHLIKGYILERQVWRNWCRQGIHLLFVYSNSRQWKEYIEKEILPQLPEQKIVLNWSERRMWDPRSLPTRVFYQFSGNEEFCPIAMIFWPRQAPNIFRFYRAFKDLNHGKSEPLRKLQAQLFVALEA